MCNRDFAVLRIVQLNASKAGTVYGSVRGNDALPLRNENGGERERIQPTVDPDRHSKKRVAILTGVKGGITDARQRNGGRGKNRARYDILPDDATSSRPQAIELKVANSKVLIPTVHACTHSSRPKVGNSSGHY